VWRRSTVMAARTGGSSGRDLVSGKSGRYSNESLGKIAPISGVSDDLLPQLLFAPVLCIPEMSGREYEIAMVVDETKVLCGQVVSDDTTSKPVDESSVELASVWPIADSGVGKERTADSQIPRS
jgi:hypothetical protein